MTTLHWCIRTLVLAAFAGGLAPASDTRAATNQWTPIGPGGAAISALAFGGQTTYAGTAASGVLKSVDAGATWVAANDGLADARVLSLAVDPRTPSLVYAGSASGLWKSVDGAAHWVSAGFHDDAHRSVRSVAIDPATPDVVYAATSAGLYKSIDGARTWSPSGFADFVGNEIAVDRASPATLYFAGDNASGLRSGIYRSTDAGTTWTKIRGAPLGDVAGDLVASHVHLDPHGGGRLYATFAADSVVASQDGGTTWSTLAVPSEALARLTAFAVDATDADTLYVGTADGSVLRSSDNGRSWVGNRAAVRGRGIDVLVSTTAALYAGMTDGLYASANAGATWKAIDLGVRRVPAQALLVDSTAQGTIYADAGGELVKTVDGGAHWTFAGAADAGVGAWAQDPASPSTLYVGSDDVYDGPSLYKSTDGGAHWSPILDDQVRAPVTAMAVAPSRPTTLYAAVPGDGIVRSTDGGATGRFVNALDDDAVRFVTALAVDPVDPDVVYAGSTTRTAGGSAPNVFKSADGGAHWQAIAVPVPRGTTVNHLAVDASTPSTLYATFLGGNGSAGFVYKSVDAGTTWFPAQSGLASNAWVKTLAIDPSDPQRLYVATAAGVYRSTNGGSTWTPLNAGLPSLDVADVALDASGKLLRAATSSGVFEYRFGDDDARFVTVVEYRHAQFDHYFVTANVDEIADLDNGNPAGWLRTGLSFRAFAAPSHTTVPVCRFFGTTFAPKSSHFYSPFATECSSVRASPHWTLETADAFDIAVPSAAGECAPGLVPVYRLYNGGQGGAPNHRYVTDRDVRAQMIAQGWVPEGIGADAVQMCSPP